jgi:hypothetical protein
VNPQRACTACPQSKRQTPRESVSFVVLAMKLACPSGKRFKQMTHAFSREARIYSERFRVRPAMTQTDDGAKCFRFV